MRTSSTTWAFVEEEVSEYVEVIPGVAQPRRDRAVIDLLQLAIGPTTETTVTSSDGSFRQSKWFYERARGQYQDARGHLSQADRRRFDLDYPKKQVFTKTDLAKFLSVWHEKPHVVSRGAQKNFADFASSIGREWDRNSDGFNEMYYREAIAKAIVFRSVENLVTQQPWYQGGYRANVVAYAIAKLSHDVAQNGGSINFDRIWRAQEISPGLRETLRVAAKAVHDVIVDSPDSMRNVTEWAKQGSLLEPSEAAGCGMARSPEGRDPQFGRPDGCETGCRQGPANAERHRGSDDCGPNRLRFLERCQSVGLVQGATVPGRHRDTGCGEVRSRQDPVRTAEPQGRRDPSATP